ncbi:cytosolic sulfotransferase 7-like [Silene latifolia]|uniref:cytosolic sulfotransferase 7-like n=1 Tax=Silene latifolia TaxID=37657 RepID=UPI003D76BA2C
MVRDVYSAFKVPIAMATTEKEQKDDAPSFIDELPKVGPPEREADLVRWKGFWVTITLLNYQFHPLPSDIILASFPKTGTTWLKALTITLLNYHNIKQDFNLQIFNPLQQQKQGLSPKVDDPLLTKNPHQIVPFLELECFGDDSKFDTDTMKSSLRVFNTHLSYSMLPDNVKKSGCKLVYIARNPMDTFVSWWHLFHNKPSSDITMNQSFDQFCRGVVRGGPYFDHVLGYWRVSEENKGGVLFLTYEELKVDSCKHVKRLADFLGCSLNPDEIEQVVGKCTSVVLKGLVTWV